MIDNQLQPIYEYLKEIEFLPQKLVIYGLIDPISSQMRYVGKAEILKERMRRHYLPSVLKAKTHKNNWLKHLLDANKRVIVWVIEECADIPSLNEAEIDWIGYFKYIG